MSATRVAVSLAERRALMEAGHPMRTLSGNRQVVMVEVPHTAAGARLLLALAELRDPNDEAGALTAVRTRLARAGMPVQHSRRTDWRERTSITLSDVYGADERRVSPIIGSMAERMQVPHPLDGVTYADGVCRSRLPWRVVPT